MKKEAKLLKKTRNRFTKECKSWNIMRKNYRTQVGSIRYITRTKPAKSFTKIRKRYDKMYHSPNSSRFNLHLKYGVK